MLALSKAFALASASDEAREIRDEVGFLQAIRAALVKSAPGGGKTAAERELADPADRQPRRGLDRDRRHHGGGGNQSPDISDPVRRVPGRSAGNGYRKNLALEALEKLINGEVRSQASETSSRLEPSLIAGGQPSPVITPTL